MFIIYNISDTEIKAIKNWIKNTVVKPLADKTMLKDNDPLEKIIKYSKL